MGTIVIDIGGTSVKGAVYSEGYLRDSQTVLSPKTWSEMSNALDDMIKYYLTNHRVESLSFSVPGIANQRTGQIDGASSLYYLHGLPFKNFFEKKFNLPVYFENDANCACVAELSTGVAKGAKNVVFIVIGTGIGGTIVMNGEIITGAHQFAGEFGMMLDDNNEEWSVRGSAVHMARSYSEEIKQQVSGHEVFDHARGGEVLAQNYINELCLQLAKGIYNLQYILDPEFFVLGGGISENLTMLTILNEKLDEVIGYGQRSPIKPKVVSSFYKNEANLIGAGIISQKLNWMMVSDLF